MYCSVWKREAKMQKISPLRSSIEAFNKFKMQRLQNKDNKAQNPNQTNPFGIAFKGKVIQMDVFENSNKTEENKASVSIKEKLQNTGKLVASAWVGTINKFSSLKANAIAFGNKIKENSVNMYNKIKELSNTSIELDLFKYNVSRLQKQPVSELKLMLQNELQGA